MKKILGILAVLILALIVAIPANAEQKPYQVLPTTVEGSGWGIMYYQHGIRLADIDLQVYTEHWPTHGTMVTHFGGEVDVKQLTFHRIEGDSSWFSSIETGSWFSETYEIGQIHEPGDFDVVVEYADDNGHSTRLTFDIRLLQFDFRETICLNNNGMPMLDLTVYSFEDVPAMLDSISIELPYWRTLNFYNIPINNGGVGAGFGWVNFRYRNYGLLAGKELPVTFTMNGESITTWVYFPFAVNARSTCDRG